MIGSQAGAGFGDNSARLERDPVEHQVCVRRVGVGWCVEGDGLERLMFRAEGQAERQARGLALGFASCGCDTCVRVHDTEGLLVAIIRYYGAEAAGAGPAAKGGLAGRKAPERGAFGERSSPSDL